MKCHTKILGAVLAAALLFFLAGCKAEESAGPSAGLPEGSAGPSDAVGTGTGTDGAGDPAFSYSDGIADNGFFEGVTALGYTGTFEYLGIEIPENVHQISDEAVQSEIDGILAGYAVEEQVTDRAAADGDTVNIDYVGSVGGVAFSGGSTGGAGTNVTIGVTNYIDDFLQQIVGRMPGETFDVEVTFPANYGVENLNGKDAVFVTTLNYIVESSQPELTDDFVAEHYAAQGWTTADELRADAAGHLQQAAIEQYISDHLIAGVELTQQLPDSVLNYMSGTLVEGYRGYAAANMMDFEAFLGATLGISSEQELLELYKADVESQGKYALILQAIAEDAGISVGEAEIAAYFDEEIGAENYASYEARYGKPSLAQMVLFRTVMEYLSGNAVLL